MKTLFKFIFSLLIISLISLGAFAQLDFDDDINDVPIDGGASLLLAAGIGYGAKKIIDSRKKNDINDN